MRLRTAFTAVLAAGSVAVAVALVALRLDSRLLRDTGEGDDADRWTEQDWSDE